MQLIDQIANAFPTAMSGTVVRTDGLAVSVAGLPCPVGGLVRMERQTGPPVFGEVIGFRHHETVVYPFADVTGLRRGNHVHLVRTTRVLQVGDRLLGRVVDARGRVIDGKPVPALADRVPLHRSPPRATERPRIDQTIATGIRSIDGLLSCGMGQRMGVFSGSGVGKSVSMGMIARNTSADVNVIGLIGERGREVNEFLERDLGAEGLKRSVVVVSTGDEPAVLRVQAAFAATAIAEYFRDRGSNVMLMMDSLTRFAMAQREIGLAAGEPPTTRGYPPSVFSQLPKLLERAGRSPKGSITGLYTVLVEGDDPNEPVSDAVRGLLDGHTILSREIAARGHYPAVDVLSSISRLMPDLVPDAQLQAARTIRELLAASKDHRDLISIGAYRAGSNVYVDAALALEQPINQFLRQDRDQIDTFSGAQQQLLQLARQAEGLIAENRT